MTNFSKILTVLVLSLCLAFLGISSVTLLGGANWEVERDTVTDDYQFTTTPGETTTYSVKARRGGRDLASGAKSLAATVIAARKDMADQQIAQIADLKQKAQEAAAEQKTWSELIDEDEKAMTARCDALAAELAAINQFIDDASKKNIATAEKTQNTLRQNESRREEVYRLLSQLDEIKTDLYQINEQQKRLRDLLVRKRGVVNRLKRRQIQLVESGAKGQYEQVEPTGSKPQAEPGSTTPATPKKPAPSQP